ncbi:HdeD family acid-resistance protein [Kitasatospora cheerisanensis]|uniref:Membrane protein n=1 Tax=Kitasatospora cheerisanensis KCTC 2395 TaxID=1348663 RepID=A0A066YPQ0_9ACTN|nr:HdeD family acid-resistance protein [Kitasatospora cheerisanensis]KDN81969.1 membrane protein [Kitasatospora cheerisanensis KCTC 2395]
MADPYRTEDRPGLAGPFQQLARLAWQAVLTGGLISLALGVVVLVWPKQTLWVVGVLFGLYLLVIGVVQLVAAFGTHASTALRVLAFVSGAICVLLGLLCFRSAAQSILLLALWIGIGWLFRGITQLAAVASDPLMPARGWQGFIGTLNLLAGIVLMVWPAHSITALAILAGCGLLVIGVAEIVAALQIRSGAKQFPREL